MEELGSQRSQEVDSVFMKARDAAFRLLSHRDRSEAEVRRRLLRSYDPEIVERVIDSLRRHRLFDDQAFAQQWREGRERHRPRAQRLVRQELLRLGVSHEVVQAALEGFDDGANAYQAGLKLARRLVATECSEEEFRRRLWSHLQRRGFSYGQVKETADRLWDELATDFLHRQDNAEDNK